MDDAMMILAIDPSPLHTAFVLGTRNPESGAVTLIEAHTHPIMAAAQHFNAFLIECESRGVLDDVKIVIERPPFSRVGGSTESEQNIAAYWLLMWIAELHEMSPTRMAPGAWKPAAKGWKLQYPSALEDQHQRDAYGMLRVWLEGKRGHGSRQ